MKDNLTDFAARLLLGFIFVIAGLGKIGSGLGVGAGYAASQAYMASVGLPEFLLGPTIILELGGGLALILGLKVRWAAAALAGFSVAAGLLFHLDLSDSNQINHLLKNLAMAGGLMLLALEGGRDWAMGRRLGFE